MLQKFLFLLQVSRIYQWPLFSLIALYGFAVSNNDFGLPIATVAFLFSFPLQLCLNGINDIYDRETDAHNDRKKHWIMGVRLKESDITLVRRAVWISTLFIVLCAALIVNLLVFLLICFGLVLGFAYSIPPIRTKERPFLCLLTYYLGYLCIVLSGFYAQSTGILRIFSFPHSFPPVQPILLGLGVVGFAALSFVLDTEADKKAGLTTISTRYGNSLTLFITAVCFGILSFWFAMAGSWIIMSYLTITTLLALISIIAPYKKLPFVTMIWMFAGAIGILVYKLGIQLVI